MNLWSLKMHLVRFGEFNHFKRHLVCLISSKAFGVLNYFKMLFVNLKRI